MDPRAVVAEALKLWGAQDVESTFEYVAEDVIYTLHFDEALAPYAGVTHGREAVKAAFYGMIAEFDYLKWEPVIMAVDDDMVRVQIRFDFHHRRTGANLEGSMRTIFTVKNGLIVRCEEFLDKGLVEAFMRLTRQREAENNTVAPPEIPQRRPPEKAGHPHHMTMPASDKIRNQEECGEH